MSFDGGVPQTWGDREGQRCGYVVVFAIGQKNEDPDNHIFVPPPCYVPEVDLIQCTIKSKADCFS